MNDTAFKANDPEHLFERISALEADKAGEDIEFLNNMGRWVTVTHPSFEPSIRYRRAPNPAMRPWSCPADVPGPVCWMRSFDSSAQWLAVGVNQLGVVSYCNSQWIGPRITNDSNTPLIHINRA